MFRGRKSLHGNADDVAVATGSGIVGVGYGGALYNDDRKHTYKNYYNNNTRIRMKNEYENVSENMQGKRFTQSSNVEYWTEETTTDSLTASTASLLTQEQRQRQQYDGGHGILTQRSLRFKRTFPGGAHSHTQQQHNNNPQKVLKVAGDGSGGGYGVVAAATGVTLAREQHQQHLSNNNKSSSLLSTTSHNSIRRIRRPRQWLPPQTEFEEHQHHSDVAGLHQTIGNSFKDYKGEEEKINVEEKVKAFCIEFLTSSSIHGFIYLAKFGQSIVERLIWFAFICVAVFAIISLSNRTWERFQNSPMVISMDRNKLVWNTSFPSLTVCPHKRIDELKVEEYMEENEQNFKTEEDKEDFRDFIVKLASLTYDNIETLPINKSFGIPSYQYLDLLYKLKWNFEPEMSSGAAVKMYIYETLTEFGICHSVNSLVARYNGYDYWKRNDWSLLEHGDRVTVHPLDGEIYAQIINLSTAYDVYFHGAGDIPNISKQRYTFPETDYTTVELIALEIYTAEEARAFTTKQRKCRFQYEADEMMTVPIYSFGLCLAECRMQFSMRVCGCVPHFYRNRLKTGRVLPICGFDGLSCLADIKREIISLKSDRYKINCNCLSNCDDSNFFVQSYRSRVWFLGANLQWGIIDYPKMQLRRDVLFSFADVLVYIGGLVGFFLGCSILSFTEVVYFFTARFVKRMFFN